MYSVFGRKVRLDEPIASHEDNYIIIPKSTYELANDPDTAWVLVEIIVNWVDNSFAKNGGNGNNIPLRALQLYCANHYYSFVQNGGHRDFIKASAHKAGQVWPFILAGLLAMNAKEHANIFQEMADWVSRNVDEAVDIEKDGEHLLELFVFDGKFEALEINSPFCFFANEWISQWSELKIMDDIEFRKEMALEV